MAHSSAPTALYLKKIIIIVQSVISLLKFDYIRLSIQNSFGIGSLSLSVIVKTKDRVMSPRIAEFGGTIFHMV
jgi:hypothetical protein